jgi:hypothetical protein
MIHMKQQILEVLLPFISFSHEFDKKNMVIMLVLMFNMRFKNMWLVTIYLDCKMLLLNMMKSCFFIDKSWNKLLLPTTVEEIEDLQS